MTIRYPIDKTDYKGKVRFYNLGPGENIELYLPSSFQVGDKVEYANMGIGAAFAATANSYQASQGATQFRNEDATYDTLLGGASLSTGIALGVQKAVAMFSDKGAAAASDASRVAPNPNTRAIFKQVNLRSFQFTFKMIPTNESEAENIREIIREFRTNLYPESEGLIAYKFPPTFDIEAFYMGNSLDIKFKPCYLESLITNYNPSGQAFMVNPNGSGKGYFSEIDLSLTFMEARTLDRDAVEAGF